MRREWELEDLIECWTLNEAHLGLIADKSGATRLGFALALKFFAQEARFLRHAGELPPAAVKFAAGHVKVDPAMFAGSARLACWAACYSAPSPPPVTCAGSWSPNSRAGRGRPRPCDGGDAPVRVRPRRGGTGDVRGWPPQRRCERGAGPFMSGLDSLRPRPQRPAPKAAPARSTERPSPISTRVKRLNTTENSLRTAPKSLSVTSVR
jgi:hypothetical protein